MKGFYFGMATFLLITIVVGLWRVARGPSQTDRMLAVQLFGTTGVAILLLLAEAFSMRALENVALVFALLAVMITATFNRRVPAGTPGRR